MTDYQSSDKTMVIITKHNNTIFHAVIIIVFTYSNRLFLFPITSRIVKAITMYILKN